LINNNYSCYQEVFMQRFSKKRQAILDCLRSTTSHPPAEWIYANLQAAYPTLSLATVYRNLNQLKDAGVIRSLGVVDGHERFDGNPAPHSHALCCRCGAIIDIEAMNASREMIAAVEQATGFRVSETSLQFRGLCSRCAEQEQASGSNPSIPRMTDHKEEGLSWTKK
jgi:Fur family peroxide stress response transcriptional regulator